MFAIPPPRARRWSRSRPIPKRRGRGEARSFKTPAPGRSDRVADYRRDLVSNLYTDAQRAIRRDRASRRSTVLDAGARRQTCSAARGRLVRSAPRAGRRDRERDWRRWLLEEPRACANGLLRRRARARQGRTLARAASAAYAERDKTESAGFAREYVSYFLTAEPAPGIENEHEDREELLDGISLDEVKAVRRAVDRGRQPCRARRAAAKARCADRGTVRAVLDRDGRRRSTAAWDDSAPASRSWRSGRTPGRWPIGARSPARRHVVTAVERRRGVARADRLQSRRNRVCGPPHSAASRLRTRPTMPSRLWRDR